jgi:hypothetical protein
MLESRTRMMKMNQQPMKIFWLTMLIGRMQIPASYKYVKGFLDF